jgi:hypothetical protein
LLLTHYWSLFLLATLGLWHLPGALRRRPHSPVVVPLVAVAAGAGALALPGRRLPWTGLALLTALGLLSGVASAATPRT